MSLSTCQQLLESSGVAYQKVYASSIRQVSGLWVFMFKDDTTRYLAVDNALAENFDGVTKGDITVCALTVKNAIALQAYFPYTKPSSHAKFEKSFGLGDRLGVASPAHLRLFAGTGVFPVIAQQSMRELTMTKRTYPQVIACATFAAFQEGFETGWGADGDHLKKLEEVQDALSVGCTMITLDCSENIDKTYGTMSDAEILSKAQCNDQIASLIAEYGKPFALSDASSIDTDKAEIARNFFLYGEAISFAKLVYEKAIVTCSHAVDFEISIDETDTPTTPSAHLYVANELSKAGVKFVSMAPRFCGEFQKGVDYRGDIAQFEREFKQHQAIADHFGYKISVHSGSDKFSVFPIVGRISNGKWHVKTAGTNWLETVRLIAAKVPSLYRELHGYALSTAFAQAKKLYHVTTVLENIPQLSSLKDHELVSLMDMDDARQLMHITYGNLMTDTDASGNLLYGDRIMKAMHDYEDEYATMLISHIGRHLTGLGVALKS